ncbi:MAG: extensin family protein [Sandaracinaceae bacterium]
MRLLVLLLLVFPRVALAQDNVGSLDASSSVELIEDEDLAEPAVLDEEVACADEVVAADAPAPVGRTIANLDAEACHALLRTRSVPFQGLEPDAAQGVGIPIRLTGTVDGIAVSHRGGSELHEIVDCRLAVAILEWAPLLREAGITALRHYSIYRPDARVAQSGRVSGHAHGMAIDLGRIERDGELLTVLDGWEAREHGVNPCEGPFEESEASARLRAVVCQAVERDLFQVVLTPHHDRAHQNHVHLEVRPGVDWSYVH